MWIMTSHGRAELVRNPDHIKRLLAEGGYEIEDPHPKAEEATEPEPVAESEESDGSPVNDEQPDSKNKANDRRSKRSKPAV